MKWTKDLPAEIGWYFTRSRPTYWVKDRWPEKDVVRIYQQDGEFIVEFSVSHKVPLSAFEPEKRAEFEFEDEWAGPIEEPEESEDA